MEKLKFLTTKIIQILQAILNAVFVIKMHFLSLNMHFLE